MKNMTIKLKITKHLNHTDGQGDTFEKVKSIGGEFQNFAYKNNTEIVHFFE